MREFVEFLSAQSPYDQLDTDDLRRLARKIDVEFFGAGAVIVEADGPTLEHIYIVRTGSVEVVDRGRTVDVLGPGDTFGHISVFSGLPPPMMVRATEETLCYQLPDPRTLVEHPERLRFSHYGSLVARERVITSGGSIARLERPLVDVLNPITWCTATEPISTVAKRMTDTGQSCALLTMGSQIGIVTDDDFRRLVATGAVPVDAPISTIASAPVFSVTEDLTVSDAYLEIVEHGVHHLVVTDVDGKPTGIARVVDMAEADVRHPLVIRSAIAAAQSLPQLVEACALLHPTMVELWETGVPPEHIGAVLSTMVDAIVRKVTELRAQDGPFAHLDCSWMVLGSMGRREPLPNSDVDSALVWQPDSDDTTLAREEVAAATAAIIADLEKCGLRPCPQGLNASNPLFNRSVAGWRDAVFQWRQDVTSIDRLLLASTLADARPLTNANLAQPVRRALVSGIGRDAFTKAMLSFSLNDRPPTGFVKGFVVEHFGTQKGHLNLKKAGMRPIASLARALSLLAGDTTGSTTQRLDRARQNSLLTADEAETLQGAFRLCYQLVVGEQIDAIKHGQPVQASLSVTHLDSLQRRHLRDAFRAISHVQDRVGRMRSVL